MVSNVLALISCLLGIETIVDIIGLAKKIDTTLIVEMLVEIPIVSKIDVSKIVVCKTSEEGRIYSLVDEILDISVNDVMS